MKSKLKGHLALAAAYTMFGLNIVFNKDIANSNAVSPMVMFALRSSGASLLFWILSLFMPSEKVEKKDYWRFIAASIIGLYIPQLSFLFAITMSSAIDTAVLSTLGPIITMVGAFIFLKYPITWGKLGGVLLSFIGIILLILNSVYVGGTQQTTPAGIVLILINTISFSLYLALFRPLISKYSVVTFMKWCFLVCMILSLPISAKELITTDFASIPTKILLEVSYIVVFATFLAYFLIPIGQKYLMPTLVSMYSYLQPIIAAGISIWAGLDTLSYQKVLAAILVVGGVVLVSRSPIREKHS